MSNRNKNLSLEDRYLGETGEDEPLDFPGEEEDVERKQRAKQDKAHAAESAKKRPTPDWDLADSTLAEMMKAPEGGGDLMAAIVDRLSFKENIHGGALPAEKRTAKIDRLASEIAWAQHQTSFGWGSASVVEYLAPHSFQKDKYDYEGLLAEAKETGSSIHSNTSSKKLRRPVLLFSTGSHYGTVRTKKQAEESAAAGGGPREEDFRVNYFLPEDEDKMSKWGRKEWYRHFGRPSDGPRKSDEVLKLRAEQNMKYAHNLCLISIGIVEQGKEEHYYELQEHHIVPFLWLKTTTVDQRQEEAFVLPAPKILPDFAAIAKASNWR